MEDKYEGLSDEELKEIFEDMEAETDRIPTGMMDGAQFNFK